MRPLLSNVPVWLCRWCRPRGYETHYIPARTGRTAATLAELAGLGRPDGVQYAGFSAEPVTWRPKNREHLSPSTRRAERAVLLYAMLRSSFPVRSILADPEASTPEPVLRDFVANVGAAIARLGAGAEVVDQVAAAQARAWYASAAAANARRAGLRLEAEAALERANLYRGRARRLRKRKAYALAIGNLEALLAGTTERDDQVAERFRAHLVALGYPPLDADDLASRFRRVGVPRL